MKLKLIRLSCSDICTQGILRDEDTKLVLMNTLELPWKDNQRSISCIPPDIYTVAPYTSEKYPDTFQILNVPNRTHILIHVGNKVSHTEGCVLVGKYFGMLHYEQAVLASKVSFQRLRNHVGAGRWTLEICGVDQNKCNKGVA